MNVEVLLPSLWSISSPSMLDWLGVIAPIILSVTAIVIALKIAKKQDEIALFDKRYELLRQVRDLVDLKRKVYNYAKANRNQPDVLGLYEYFLSELKRYFKLKDEDEDDVDLELMNCLEKLKYEIYTKIQLLIDIKSGEATTLTEGVNGFLGDIDTIVEMLENLYEEGEGFTYEFEPEEIQALCNWCNDNTLLEDNNFVALLIKCTKLSNNTLKYLQI